MDFVQIATEQTTAATDLISAIISLSLGLLLLKFQKLNFIYWRWFFIFFAVAALFGAIAHGIIISDFLKAALWHGIYFSLGIAMAFLLATCLPIKRKFFAFSISLGVLFYLTTVFISSSFVVFVVYAIPILLIALSVNIYRYIQTHKSSLLVMSSGIITIILSGVVQALFKGEVQFIWLFDHNGLSHIVQTIGMIVLYIGIKKRS